METATYLSCRAPSMDAEEIDTLVHNGIYLNRSDFMRAAIKKLLAEHT